MIEPAPFAAALTPDLALKRWRSTVTLLAWLLIVQSALSLLTCLIGLAAAPLVAVPNLSGQLSGLMDRSATARLDELLRLVRTADYYLIIGNAALLAGSIGLLLRRKWGWYVTILVHGVAVLATLVWGTPVVTRVYAMLDPKSAGSYGLLTALLLALMPGIVVGFLLLRPVAAQFKRPNPAA
jgi:hypothetical protein